MIKIYYSHTPFWRAEVLRVSLFISNIPFEDVRISREEFINMIKTGYLPNGKKVPFHQLPVIEVDGEIIGQTGAIARYCGKISNLYSNDNINAAKIDQIIDAATDITNLVSPTIREKDEQKKVEDNPTHVDFAKHAEAMGAFSRHCESLSDLENAMEWAQLARRTEVDNFDSTSLRVTK